jgi:hypothetical protein
MVSMVSAAAFQSVIEVLVPLTRKTVVISQLPALDVRASGLPAAELVFREQPDASPGQRESRFEQSTPRPPLRFSTLPAKGGYSSRWCSPLSAACAAAKSLPCVGSPSTWTTASLP